MSCGLNKAAIVSHANASKKNRCCCARGPLFAPGLRVQLIRNVQDAPKTTDELRLFNFGLREDIGASAGPIGLTARTLETAGVGKDPTNRELWLTTFPGLGTSGAFDAIRTRSEAEGGGTFALRLTGQIFFSSDEDTVHVQTDDGVIFSVNGNEPALGALGPAAGEVNAQPGWNDVEIVWWNTDAAGRVGGMRLALLDGGAAPIDAARFRHAI